MPLILLPNVLFEEDGIENVFPPLVEKKVVSIQGLIAESEKEARRYLKRFTFPEGKSFRDIPISLLNEHTGLKDLEVLLPPLLREETWGLISDAGLPCLADPGSQLVSLCRKHNIPVEAVSGPSSLFLALMLSGLSAQKFAFHGYLERDQGRLSLQIKELEKASMKFHQTQVCIEAPYRTESLLQSLIEQLSPSTVLSICASLTSPDELVMTFSVKEWRKMKVPALGKIPAIFLFSA